MPTGSTDLSALGVSFGTWSVQETVFVAVTLAVIATASVFAGISVIRRGTRRQWSEKKDEARVRVARLETTERLLEHRVELLLARAEELEERKAALGGGVDAEPAAPTEVDDVIVLPEVPPMPPRPGSLERAPGFIDEGRRRR